MSEKSFEDTRKSIVEFVNNFSYENVIRRNLVNKDFERDVYQILIKKSVTNFELFLFVFDEIYQQNLEDIDAFHIFMRKYKKREDNKKSVVNLYFGADDIIDRDKTIKLAFKMYGYHLEMIKSYTRMLDNARFSDISIKDLSLDKDNYKEFEYINIEFDVFLSHRYYLRFYNIVVYYVLTVYYGLTVYVDWIFDYSVDRKKLSTDTVKLLQYRMNQSKKLLFFNIKGSQTTNWMSWEVGYFSCLKQKSIGILDLDEYTNGNKNVEILSSNDTLLYNESKGIYVKNTNESIFNWINQ